MTNTSVKFSLDELNQFANLSRDYNPLHMDERYAHKTPFGQRVVFGALAVIKCLQNTRFCSELNLTTLDVEFHNTIFADTIYTLQIDEESSTEGSTELRDGVRTLLRLNYQRYATAHTRELPSDNTTDLQILTKAVEKTIASFSEGDTYSGVYSLGHGDSSDRFVSVYGQQYEQLIIMLTSYLIGMETPGSQALFSKLHLEFTQYVPVDSRIHYEIKVDKKDASLGLLFLSLNVSHSSGDILATGKLQAFVRNKIERLDREKVTALLPDQSHNALAGKTALVIGGSRGLGAEIVQALMLSGANVYLNYAHSDEEALALQTDFNDHSNSLHLVKGNVSDRQFCEETLNTIFEACGTLDIVVCNACTSPGVMDFSEVDTALVQDYIADNLGLVAIPLSVFRQALSNSNGVFCTISSIYVETGSKDFPQYVALKSTVEALVKTASLSNKEITYLVARPPKLLTDMNNTPIGAIGALHPALVATDIVAQLSRPQPDNNYTVLNQFRSNTSLNSRPITVDVPQHACKDAPEVCVSATFSIELVLPSLRHWSNALALPLSFNVTPYNQPFQELLSPQSAFHQNKTGYNLMYLRFEDWLPYMSKDAEQTDKGNQDNGDHIAFLEEAFSEFKHALIYYAQNSTTPLELFLCPSLEMAEKAANVTALLTFMTAELETFVHPLEQVQITTTENYHEHYAVTDYRDELRFEMAHIPYTDGYFDVLGILTMRRLFNYYVKPYKVIVLDCDNTLWKGVCDEVGATGVDIDLNFQRFQKFLIAQKEKGILLCLCSKNREQVVWDVFEQHPDMILSRSDLVDVMINWQPKSENIQALADNLNLGLDSFIFIDDNPVECAEVRLQLPEVLTLQAPDDSADFDRFVHHLWVLDRRYVTQEDKRRTQMYQQDKARQEAANSNTDFGSFLASLNLCVEFHELDDTSIARAAQLTRRTNQFNLSTRRRSEHDILQLTESGYLAFTLTVNDRFGEYGTVGLVLSDIREDALFIDTFLLSCRVLGRGVEHRVLANIAQLAQAHELKRVEFEYIASPKNEPVANFLNSVCKQLHYDYAIDVTQETSLVCFEVTDLMQLEFDPASVKTTRESTGKNTKTRRQAATSSHQLQALFEDVIFPLHSAVTLDRQPEPMLTDNHPSSTDDGQAPDEHAQHVISIFAHVLSLNPDTISLNAPIETIVDESYKIVDLTVALKAEYPDLPQTLLFETRSLQEIVDKISGRPTFSTVAVDKVSSNEDIAIIGMDGRFPGADNLEAFWENLKNGICSMSEIPSERWDADTYYSADMSMTDKTYCTRGGFMNNAFNFDHQFFGISPREAETMDPQQRLFLQTVWGTVENAGYTRTSLPRNTGVYLGVISSDYALNAYQAALSGWSHYRMSDYYQIPNRVSYYFDLHGPSLAIDSACSSSATALHLACQSLKQDECEAAIVGGVNFITHPSRLIQYAQMQMISKSGNCSPFSDAADGTLFGEGVCALLLKPFSKAIEDGDPIHGVIKSTAVNSGGKTNGFTVPNPTAHAQLISTALVDANIHPRTVSYIEAHGTATNLGDPIEIRGLSEGFAAAESVLGDAPVAVTDKHWCSIGSVKSNIGHLESCAALAGIVKCLLQMKHQTLVPSLTNGDFDKAHTPLPPNSKIDFDTTPLKIQYTPETWRPEANMPRRAGISSFGAGGSNGHVIVEEPPAVPVESISDAARSTQIALLSAPGKKQLVSLAERILTFLEINNTLVLDSVCYTLQTGREHFAHRLAIYCETRQQLIENLTDWLQGGGNAQTAYQHVEQISQATTQQESLTLEDSVTHWLAGIDIDWQGFYPHRLQKIALPGLEFQGRDFRIPDNYSLAQTERLPVSDNPFVGQPLDGPHISNTLYETRYDLQNLPYLTDHRIYDKVVVPGSLYVSYVLSIARELWPNQHHQLSNLTFVRALSPVENQPQRVQFSATQENDGSQTLSIISRECTSNQWHEHFSCRLYPDTEYATPGSVVIDDIIARMSNAIMVDEFYTNSIHIGFSWGPRFQCIKQLYRRDGEALGLVTLVDALMPGREHYAIHPAFLDACFQVFVPGMSSTGLQLKTRQAYLPLGVNTVHFFRPVPLTVWSHVITKDDLKKDSLTIDIYLYSEAGEMVAYFKEMQVLRASKEALMALTNSNQPADLGYTTVWQTMATSNTDTQEITYVALCGAPLARPLQNTQYLRYFEGDDCIQKALATQAAVNVVYTLELVFTTDGEQLLENLLIAIEQIQALIQSFDNTVYAPGIKLYLAVQARDEHVQHLDHCFVSLARVIAIEYPQFWGGFIEIDKTGLSSDHLHELLLNQDENHFRVGTQLQVPRLASIPMSTEIPDVIRNDGSYLITGAFGSLGQLVAKYLVGQGAKKLLLLSRRDPDTTQRSFIEALREQGAEIVYAAVDMTHRDALQAFIDSHRNTLKGVVHLAGVLEDGAFANLTREQFRRVLSPKVTGTWHLHQCTNDIPLDFFVLYSSATSLLGAAGQANYAVANAFLDAFAHYRRSLGLIATSVNWGPWSGAGMAADQDSHRKTWTNTSFGSLTPDDGLRYFSAVYGDSSLPAQVAVLPYDWKALFRHYPVQQIPSLLRNLARQAQPERAQKTASQQDDDIAAFCTQGLASAERKRLVIHYLRKQIRHILGFEESDTIEANRSFLEIGFDSLMAVSFRTALANSLNCYFPATLIFDFPNLNQLSEYIVKQLQEAEQETAVSINSDVEESEASHDILDMPGEALDHIDLSTLNQEQVEKLLESELNDIERLLEA